MNDEEVMLDKPDILAEISADYESTGLSLRPHLLSLLRSQPPYDRCTAARDLPSISSGRFVRVAGLVTGRQRPGTAKGTVFLTLEDESGNTNVVVWPKVQQNFRKELLLSKLLLVKGRVETENGVTHVIAGALEDRSEELQSLELKSRDFH